MKATCTIQCLYLHVYFKTHELASFMCRLYIYNYVIGVHKDSDTIISTLYAEKGYRFFNQNTTHKKPYKSMYIYTTSGDLTTKVSPSLLTLALISGKGLDMQDRHILASASDGSGGQFSSRM